MTVKTCGQSQRALGLHPHPLPAAFDPHRCPSQLRSCNFACDLCTRSSSSPALTSWILWKFSTFLCGYFNVLLSCCFHFRAFPFPSSPSRYVTSISYPTILQRTPNVANCSWKKRACSVFPQLSCSVYAVAGIFFLQGGIVEMRLILSFEWPLLWHGRWLHKWRIIPLRWKVECSKLYQL